jgi:hypothetical protein
MVFPGPVVAAGRLNSLEIQPAGVEYTQMPEKEPGRTGIKLSH